MLCNFFLDILMIHSYHRYGKKLSSEASQVVTQQLRLDMQHSETDSSEEQNRLAASRRFEVYKELADQHIQQVLESMLTIKKVDEDEMKQILASKVIEDSDTVTENSATDSLL